MDITEYEELGELAREGLYVLHDASTERRAILLELSAFAEFLVEEILTFQKDWNERRAALVESGDLPELPPQGGPR